MTNIVASQQGLYRPESLRARELAWQGRAGLTLGLPSAFTSLVSLGLAAATAALITFGSYARRVDMDGVVLPATGLIAISSPSSGAVEALAVREGEEVEKGALIYTLNLDTAIKNGGTQKLIIDKLMAERQTLAAEIVRKTLVSAQAEKELNEKIENLQAQVNQNNEQIATQKKFVKALGDMYAVLQALFKQHQVSLNETSAREMDWMQSRIRLQDLETNKLRLRGELDDAHYQLTSIKSTTSGEIGTLKTNISNVEEKLLESQARRSIEIRAPEAGVVTAIAAHPGQMVSVGAPLLKIVPRHSSMDAELLAPSSAIGFIRQGEQVLLRYSAFPYQKFGEYRGTVTTVARAALSPEEVQGLQPAAQPGASAKEQGPFYRITVKPDSQFVSVYGQKRPLPASMRVQAYVLLDRRPLYQWILESVYGVGRAAHAL